MTNPVPMDKTADPVMSSGVIPELEFDGVRV
jgi:hypothetical protein